MKMTQRSILGVLAGTALLLSSCQKQPFEETAKKADVQMDQVNHIKWHFVMDMDRSRECTTVGGGACFEDGWGNVFDYGGSLHPSIGDEFYGGRITGLYAKMEEVAGEMHMRILLMREHHQDGNLFVPVDVDVSDALANQLGCSSITLGAGTYSLDFSFDPHGEALVPCTYVPLPEGD